MKSSETCLDQPQTYAAGSGILARGIAVSGRLYCRSFHGAISRPVNGRYRCWQCLREFELGW
jgi:hypothetical protein